MVTRRAQVHDRCRGRLGGTRRELQPERPAGFGRPLHEKTYPTNREFFGSEWKPGVDSDPRLHILHARGLGENIAGYYSSADEYSQQVNQYSNEREMFYISARFRQRQAEYALLRRHAGARVPAHDPLEQRPERGLVGQRGHVGAGQRPERLRRRRPRPRLRRSSPTRSSRPGPIPRGRQHRALRRVLPVHALLPRPLRRGPDQGGRGLAEERHRRLQRRARKGGPARALRRHLRRLGHRQLPGRARGRPERAVRVQEDRPVPHGYLGGVSPLSRPRARRR